MNDEDIFKFSLIDNLQHKSKIPSAKTNLDLSKLNDTIFEALNVYNQEVLKISDIHIDVDKLRKKQESVIEFIKRFTDSIVELKKYMSNNFDTDDETFQDVLNSVQTIENSVDACRNQVVDFISKKCDSHRNAYFDSQVNLNSLHNVFCFVKFNKHVCPICMQNEASHFTLPCGHVYCEKCALKIKVNCFVCRQNIFKVNPLYFS